MTAAEFKVLFPEFARAADAVVTSRIGWATLRTPAAIWGDLQEQGIGWLTAHFLSILPGGKDMRKSPGMGADAYDATPYGRERKRLNSTVSSGFRVAGVRED